MPAQIAACLLILVLWLLPLSVRAQQNPVNNNMNSNMSIQYDQVMTYSVLMDPLYGYGSDESATNFAARNFWTTYTAANPNDEYAWFHYYRSVRFIAEGSAGFGSLQADLDSISNHLKRHSSGTWEQLIVDYWNSNRDPKKETQLQAAYALNPKDPLSLRFMTGVQYLAGNQARAYKYYTDWKATGDLPLSTEQYAFNVMQSLPHDAILITNGEMDTYPLLYQLQTIGNTSIKVVSMSLCSRADNRSRVFAYAGLKAPDNDVSATFTAEYIGQLAAANPGKKIYLAATCGPELLNALSPNLYCTGLAYRYSTAGVENLTFLRDNVGTKFRMDNVGKAVKSQNRFDVYYADRLEMNYYLPLLIAADQYVQAGNATRAAQLRIKAKTVRERAGYDQPLRSEE
jgi:hypothetical protein